MNRKTFEQMMSLFAATWPERAPTADTALAYWMALNHVDDRVFQQAARQCLQQCTFYPKPAEILARVTAILDVAGALPLAGGQAWTEALRLAQWHEFESNYPSRDGSSREPQVSNNDIKRALYEMGGYRSLFGLLTKDEPYRRKEFMEIYDRLRTQRIAADPEILAQPLPPPKLELAAGEEDNPLARLVHDIETGSL